MIELLWRVFAWVVSRDFMRDALIRYALKRPYSHIASADGKDVYMERYWVFNAYPDHREDDKRPKWLQALPSARIQAIFRRDKDRHRHDHPWDARSVILDNGYIESRENENALLFHARGDTVKLEFGKTFHRIESLADPTRPVITLFITFGYRGKWGFMVDGVKVPYDQYFALGANNVP